MARRLILCRDCRCLRAVAGRGLCDTCYARRRKRGTLPSRTTYTYAVPSMLGAAPCEDRVRMAAVAPAVGLRDDDLFGSIAGGVPPLVPLYLTPPLDLRTSKCVVMHRRIQDYTCGESFE